MYCVIQEFKLKKPYIVKFLKSISTSYFTVNNRKVYTYTTECEDMKCYTSYKVSFHHSYREDGKIKKKQYHLFNVPALELAYSGCCLDYLVRESIINDIAVEYCTGPREIEEIIYSKLEPLTDKLVKQLEETEIYKTDRELAEVLYYHNMREKEFDEEYGSGTYNQCYNVFGTLMNIDRLDELKAEKRRYKEAEREREKQQENYYKSWQDSFKGYESWWNDFKGKYFDDDGNFKSSYSNSSSGNYTTEYTDQEKKLLKEAFKTLALKYHPDRNLDKDTTEIMATINNLKDKMGI